METLKNILTFPVKILVFVFGLAMIYWGVEGLLSNSSEWTNIEGQVISSVEQSYTDSNSSDYKITYEYQVGTEKYTGSYTHYAALPVGGKTAVYYDPAAPEKSVHSPEEHGWQSFWGLLFGLGCVIWIARDAFMAFRRKPVKPTETS